MNFFSDQMFVKKHSVYNVDAIVFTSSKIEVTYSNSIRLLKCPLEDWEEYGYHELGNAVKYSICQHPDDNSMYAKMHILVGNSATLIFFMICHLHD